MSKSSGTSARSHADYITREGQYASREREVVGLTDGNAALKSEYLAREGVHQDRDDLELTFHGNMPGWAEENPRDFWRAADTYERANGRVYTEILVALPRELDRGEREELVREFVGEQLGERFPYTVAIHNPQAMDGGEQPHAHIMFSNRELDGVERPKEVFFKRANSKNPELGGCKKSREWSFDSRSNDKLGEIREVWERSANRALERAGLEERIDRRTLKEQGIEREPEPKMGPAVTQKLKQGQETDIGAEVIELRDFRKKEREIEGLKEELKREKGQVFDFSKAKEARENVLIFTRGGKERSEEKEERRTRERPSFKRTVDLTMDRRETEQGVEYRWKRSGEVAFVDQGERIEVYGSRNKTAIKSALQVAKEKGWEEVRVEGDLNFRRDSWLQGSLMGMKVQGYEANEIDRAALKELKREKYRKEQIYEKERFKDLQELRRKLAQEKKEREQKLAAKREAPEPSPSIVRGEAQDFANQMRGFQREIERERDVLIDRKNALGYEELTQAEAHRLAMDEVGGKRYTELKKEISALQKEMKRHERLVDEHNQEMKELGLKAYLPKNAFRVERRKAGLDKAAKEIYPRYNEKAEEYNKINDELYGPKRKLVEDKAADALAANQDLKKEYDAVSRDISALNREYMDAHELERRLRKLGKQTVELKQDMVKVKGELGIRPANEREFSRQIYRREQELSFKRKRGLGIER